MKITVAAAALALAIGTAASAFAAPPTGAAAPAAHAAAPADATTLQITGTIKAVSDTDFTLTTGKTFKYGAGVKGLKAGEKVQVHYTVKNNVRWASEVSPS